MEEFRTEVRSWLEANCPESMRQPIKSDKDYFWGGRNTTYASDDQKNWFEAMRDKGWTCPAWPKQYGGGGLNKEETKILKEEMGRLKCRVPLFSFGISMLGPALLKFASEEQKMRFLPDITAGKIRWCQGYSEPNAGSDLASLQTKAEDKGDHFLINGQKVWTSYADSADWIFCLTRTDGSGGKHFGISFILIDMSLPGVSVRPIKLISGKSPFCETFFDNVKTPKENLIGELNNGWSIAKYLLTHEREMIGSGNAVSKPLHEVAKEAVGLENGQLADEVLRRDISEWSIDAAAFKLTFSRMISEAKAGNSMGAKSSFLKYYGTELNKQKFELMLAAEGFTGSEWEGETSNDGYLSRAFLRTKGNSIEGGTSEVQLNIISKRVLELPSN